MLLYDNPFSRFARLALLSLLAVLALVAPRMAGAQETSPPAVAPTDQRAAYLVAHQKREAAIKASGPEQARLWGEAAALYELILRRGPGRDEAPEAAFTGAYAYKQIGDHAKAVSLYKLFIAEYGSEERLAGLEKGDPRALSERLQYLANAYEVLALAFVQLFDFPSAAETYVITSANRRLSPVTRRTAARNALVFLAALGRRPELLVEHAKLLGLGPSAREKLDADYIVASEGYGNAPADAVATARTSRALATFFEANRTTAPESRYVVEAAYRVATLARTARDPAYRSWFARVVSSGKAFRAKAVMVNGKSEADLPPVSDYLEEAERVVRDSKPPFAAAAQKGLEAFPTRGDASPSPTPP